MMLCEIKDDNGNILAAFTLSSKNFKTGSVGFYQNGKIEIDEKRYQFQVQLVEIGSRKRAEEQQQAANENTH